MENIIPLLLLLVLYLVPELLKRRKDPKDYKYPDIPDTVPQPSRRPPIDIISKPASTPITDVSMEAPKSWVTSPKPATTMPAPVTVPYITTADSPWQGKLSPQIVENGLIFSEIIQPPRAYRPIWRRPK